MTYTTESDILAMIAAYQAEQDKNLPHESVLDYEFSYMSAALQAYLARRPTYTTEADIEAMAENAFVEWNPHPPMHSLMLNMVRVNQKKPFIAGYIAGASTVHEELARLKAENERLRHVYIDLLELSKEEYQTTEDIDERDSLTAGSQWEKGYCEALRRCVSHLEQALQQKGGE